MRLSVWNAEHKFVSILQLYNEISFLLYRYIRVRNLKSYQIPCNVIYKIMSVFMVNDMVMKYFSSLL